MEIIKENELMDVSGGKFPTLNRNSNAGQVIAYPVTVLGYAIGALGGATGMAYSLLKGFNDVLCGEWHRLSKKYKKKFKEYKENIKKNK